MVAVRCEPTPNQQGGQPRWRDLKVTKKSAAATLRTAKQSESHTDHLYHLPGHHSLTCSGRGWALRLRLQRSVPGRGLGLAVWRQPEGLGSSVPWTREQNAISKGTQEESGPVEEVRCHCWEGRDHYRNIFPRAHADSQRARCLWCSLRETRCPLCRLQVARNLLCGLGQQGANHDMAPFA